MGYSGQRWHMASRHHSQNRRICQLMGKAPPAPYVIHSGYTGIEQVQIAKKSFTLH